MSNDPALVTLESAGGEAITCQILDMFEFMAKQYALLLRVEDETLVIMRTVVRDQRTVFQTIEDLEEFDQVVEHVQMIGRMQAGESND